MSTSQHEKSGDIQDVVCIHCRTTNPTRRRFCGRCGQRLWEPCNACGAPNATDLEYCGHCGGRLPELFQLQRDKYVSWLQRSDNLRKEGRYLEAIAILQDITGNGDTRLDAIVQQAEGLRTELADERSARAEEAARRLTEAKELLRQSDFAAAAQLLNQVPVGLRDRDIQASLNQATSALDEIRTLMDLVRRAMEQKQWDGLLPHVQRLCDLRPADVKLQQLADRLERHQAEQTSRTYDRLLATAKKAFLAGNYAAAVDQLAAIDVQQLSSHLRSTYDTICEVGWFVQQLKQSPFVSPHLLQVADRWQKLRPEDADPPRLAAELRRRLAAKRRDTRVAPAWSKTSVSSAIGLPVSWWCGWSDNIVVSPEAAAGAGSASRYMAAFGLALQGLGLAALPLNLIPANRSLLPRLSLLNRAGSGEAWGIDLGHSGVKALKLRQPGKTETIVLEDLHFVPYDKPLSDCADEESVLQVKRSALEQLVERAAMTSAGVVLGYSGPRSLIRTFEIPRLPQKRIKDAVGYEARLQIPIPIEHIEFDWHDWPSLDDEHGAKLQTISLIAARREHIQSLVTLCQNLPMRVLAANSVCLALYNAAIWQWFPQQRGGYKGDKNVAVSTTATSAGAAESPSPCGTAATWGILDLGAEATNVIVASPHAMRFRSIQLASNRLDQALMKTFQMTRHQAQQLREQPQRARWMYAIDEQVCAFSQMLQYEVQRTLQAFVAEGLPVERILITGGLSEQLGLIRALCHGAGPLVG